MHLIERHQLRRFLLVAIALVVAIALPSTAAAARGGYDRISQAIDGAHIQASWTICSGSPETCWLYRLAGESGTYSSTIEPDGRPWDQFCLYVTPTPQPESYLGFTGCGQDPIAWSDDGSTVELQSNVVMVGMSCTPLRCFVGGEPESFQVPVDLTFTATDRGTRINSRTQTEELRPGGYLCKIVSIERGLLRSAATSDPILIPTMTMRDLTLAAATLAPTGDASVLIGAVGKTTTCQSA